MRCAVAWATRKPPKDETSSGARLLAVDFGDGPGRAGGGIEKADVDLGNCWSMCTNSWSTLDGSAASQACVVALVSSASRVGMNGKGHFPPLWKSSFDVTSL